MSVIKLGSNIASLTAQRRLAESTQTLSRTYERLSSGQRINRASDDATGLAISQSLRADAKVFAQGHRNLNDGLSLLNIADSGLGEFSSIITRLEELAEQAANGTYGDQQRQALDAEAQALSKEYLRISQSTKFNGFDLLSGSLRQVTLQAGYSQVSGSIGSDTQALGGGSGLIGTGSFGAAVSFGSVGGLPSSLITGDFNGDGILDLARTDPGTLTVRTMLGLGDGSFAPEVSHTASLATGIATGDLNGDGVLDLVTSNFFSTSLSVLLGVGNGSFAPPAYYTTGVSTTSVSIGDFNGDGALDLAAPFSGGTALGVLLGLGDGSFAPQASYATAGNNPLSVSTGDFNGDGFLDLVTADGNSHTVSILIGLGDGSFAAPASYATGSNPNSVSTGDFNGDGALDLAVADRTSNTLSVLLGLGNGTFAPRVSYAIGSNPNSVSTGDFNGDGVLDIVTSESGSNTLSVLLGLGNGAFAPRVSYATASGSSAVETGDFNGDGVLDLVTANTSVMNIFFGETQEGTAPSGVSAPLPDFSLKTVAGARQAFTAFQRKHEQIASQRGQIGAFQSRVASAVNTLSSARENYLAAESRITDADMAHESAALVRTQILQKVSSAVLAQANQQPGIALRLLEQRLE